MARNAFKKIEFDAKDKLPKRYLSYAKKIVSQLHIYYLVIAIVLRSMFQHSISFLLKY